MRILIFLLLIACVLVGIVFGAFNADLVQYDFGFGQLALPKGASLLTALVVGWLLGGFTAWWGVNARHRRTHRRKAEADKASSGT